jgi:hypothetical protein
MNSIELYCMHDSVVNTMKTHQEMQSFLSRSNTVAWNLR